MEERDKNLIEEHIKHDEELKKFFEEHIIFEKQLEELNEKVYLTPDEEMKQKQIKKLKLAGRDKIEMILKKYR
jgi:hypothetical protein